MNPFQPTSHGTTCERNGRASQSSCIGWIDERAQTVEHVCLVGEQIGLTNEDRYEISLGDITQHRQHIEPDPIA